MQPQRQVFENFSEEFSNVFQTQDRSDSDPRPFYLLSVGDHVHRVNAHDSVPHVWAGRAQIVKNHINWMDANESMTDGIQTRDVVRAGKTVKQAGLPVWAGSIVNNVLRDHADLLVTTIETFEGRPEQEIEPALFNCLIAGGESFPFVIEPDWRVRDARLNSLVPPLIQHWKDTPRKWLDLANEKGGLAIRRAMVVTGAKSVESGDLPQRQLYLRAIEEVIAAYDRFASSMHLYLNEQERLIQSTKEEGTKAAYDPYDRYLLWLLGRKGIEAARGVTRDDMASLINATKQNGQQPAMTRDDIAAIASEAARAAVQATQPVAMTGDDSFEVDKAKTPEPKKR